MKLQSKKAGLPPGSLVHIGERKMDDSYISVVRYNGDSFSREESKNIDELNIQPNKDERIWINVDGVHNAELIGKIGASFKLHKLLTEDVLDTSIRPKVEEYDNCLFISLKIIDLNKKNKEVVIEQICMVLGKDWMITFQEKINPLFDGLIDRLEENKGVIRSKGLDYLLFRLLDIIVDNYFFIVENANDLILDLEEDVIKNNEEEHRTEILKLKRQLINFKKMVYPLRERLSYFTKDANDYISEYSVRYFADVHENVGQIIDAIESEREMLNSVMDLYQTGVSNRMNHVMQFLTIMSSVFIPLTFIAGLYGMNFRNMPELENDNGYYITLGVMGFIMIVLVIYFKRKKWL